MLCHSAMAWKEHSLVVHLRTPLSQQCVNTHALPLFSLYCPILEERCSEVHTSQAESLCHGDSPVKSVCSAPNTHTCTHSDFSAVTSVLSGMYLGVAPALAWNRPTKPCLRTWVFLSVMHMCPCRGRFGSSGQVVDP